MLKLSLGLAINSNSNSNKRHTPNTLYFSTVADGWVLQLSMTGLVGGTFDLGTDEAPKVSISVSSKSWTTGGVETTKSRTVYGKKMLRKPYPDQLSQDETQSGSNIIENIVLNDFIYTGDTINSITVLAGFFTDDGPGGTDLANEENVLTGVTNNSTEVYPIPAGTWLNPDLERVGSTSHVVRMTMGHRHFEQGQMARAVKFIATDVSLNTTSVISTSMSKVSYSASGLSASCFEGTLNFTGLTQGEMVSIDAIIYPWIGDSFQVSVDGSPYPSPNLTLLKALNNKTGAYGTAYAYVDGVGGAPAVSETPATAQAAPYANVAAAAAAIQTYNNANFGRDSASGGVIRLEVFNHVHASFSSVITTTIPIIIEAANPANKATTIYQDAGVTTGSSIPALLKFKDITLQATADVAFLSGQSVTLTGNFALILENVDFDANGITVQYYWIIDVGMMYMINCTGDDMKQSEATSLKAVKSIGCNEAGSIGGSTYNAVGTIALDSTFVAGKDGSATNHQVVSSLLGWCHIGNGTVGEFCVNVQRDIQHFAYPGCVIEKYGDNSPTVEVCTSSSDQEMSNYLDIGSTVEGARTNVLYNSEGTVALKKDGISSLSYHNTHNTKTDIFGANGNLIGNWPFLNRVGSFYRAVRYPALQLEQGNVGSWAGEVLADGDIQGTDAAPLNADWVDDQSLVAAGTGGGDYTPGPLTELPQIPAGLTAYPFDQKGRVVPTDGTAYVGAIQKV